MILFCFLVYNDYWQDRPLHHRVLGRLLCPVDLEAQEYQLDQVVPVVPLSVNTINYLISRTEFKA